MTLSTDGISTLTIKLGNLIFITISLQHILTKILICENCTFYQYNTLLTISFCMRLTRTQHKNEIHVTRDGSVHILFNLFLRWKNWKIESVVSSTIHVYAFRTLASNSWKDFRKFTHFQKWKLRERSSVYRLPTLIYYQHVTVFMCETSRSPGLSEL